MRGVIFFTFILFILSSFGCVSSTAITTNNIPTSTTTTTNPSITPPSTITREPAPSIIPTVTMTPDPVPFLFSTPGSFQTSTRTFSFLDTSREDREISVIIRYPAKLLGDQNEVSKQGAPPNFLNAPYPVILMSAKVATIFASHLSSYGFITVGIKKLDTYEPWDHNLIDQPLDILFALESIASQPLGDLDGMLDPEHTGVMGYSFDGYNSLALSGAQIDPEFYLGQCRSSASMEPALSEWRIWYFCDLATKWEQFAAHAGGEITESSNGLWQPLTDPRILAVMPMAPEGAWLFGERGLAAVDRPMLIVGATSDGICPYEMEAVYIFEHLTTTDRYMISFVGEGHMMIFDAEPVARMKHFATAFFGYYLQGNDDDLKYFSEDFVMTYPDLAWGVYK